MLLAVQHTWRGSSAPTISEQHCGDQGESGVMVPGDACIGPPLPPQIVADPTPTEEQQALLQAWPEAIMGFDVDTPHSEDVREALRVATLHACLYFRDTVRGEVLAVTDAEGRGDHFWCWDPSWIHTVHQRVHRYIHTVHSHGTFG